MPGSIRTVDATSQRYDEPAGEFPIHTSEEVLLDRRRRDLISQLQLPPSPADSVELESDQMSSPSALVREEQRITRGIDRGAPRDQAIFSDAKTPEQKALAKRKSQYYGDVFAYREPNSSSRERISRESMIMCDIKTNVIVQDEFTLITSLCYQLSCRYQRPESSILVTITHSACLLFGGSFDPAYAMTITALASQLQSVTNKRNASLIQKAMEEELGVVPERGLIKFIPIAEENFATNGKTVAGEIDDLERQTTEDNANLRRSLSRGTMKSRKRMTTKSLRNLKIGSQLPTHEEQMTPPINEGQTPPRSAMPTAPSPMDVRAEKAQKKMGRRKSFIAAVFGKSG